MLAIPAIDLREGRCVQLVGGDYDKEAVRLDDEPLDVARRWAAVGFSRLHVVDLDAATGAGRNGDIMRELLRAQPLPMQVGGGVREDESLAAWFEAGAEQVIVGTRGIEDPAWLEERASAWPGRIVLAADVHQRAVTTRGWRDRSARRIEDVISDIRGLALAGVLITAVHREGRMEGADLALIEDAVDASPVPVIAAGGIGSMLDLRNLEERGVAAAVLGMALYTGVLDARVVAEEFAS